jgi:hypothetical protein
MEERLKKELEKTDEQIFNLENILVDTNITVKIPDEEFLTELYNNLKTFTMEDKSKFISEASKNLGINPDDKKFNTIRDEQRKFLSDKLKEKREFIISKMNISEQAKEA